MEPKRVPQTPLYNPLRDDFTCELRDENNVQHTITMPSRQISYFDEPMAKVLKKRLADYIYFQTNMSKAYDLAIEEILHGEDGIEVHLP